MAPSPADLERLRGGEFPVTVQHADGTAVAYGYGQLEPAESADAEVLVIYDELRQHRRRSIPARQLRGTRPGSPGMVVEVNDAVDAEAGPTVRSRGVKPESVSSGDSPNAGATKLEATFALVLMAAHRESLELPGGVAGGDLLARLKARAYDARARLAATIEAVEARPNSPHDRGIAAEAATTMAAQVLRGYDDCAADNLLGQALPLTESRILDAIEAPSWPEAPGYAQPSAWMPVIDGALAPLDEAAAPAAVEQAARQLIVSVVAVAAALLLSSSS